MANPTLPTDKGKIVDQQGLYLKIDGLVDADNNVISTEQQAAITVLTDSSGGATGNNTLAAMVTQVALVDNSGGAAVDGTIAAVTDAATSANAIKELATTVNLHTTAINTARDNLADLAAKVNTILATLVAAGTIAE
jgi:hypothetical protein